MEFKIFQNQDYNSLKELERSLDSEVADLKNAEIYWDFVEEIAVGIGKGTASGIYYYALPSGCKPNLFSYKKINHAILILYNNNIEECKTYFYRLKRRLKVPSQRVVFLSGNESEIKAEITSLLALKTHEVSLTQVVQFSCHIKKREEIEDFLNLCRENKVKNLEYANTFPVNIEDEETIGSFISQEIFLFTGEIEPERLKDFVACMQESGFGFNHFSYSFVNKILSKDENHGF